MWRISIITFQLHGTVCTYVESGRMIIRAEFGGSTMTSDKGRDCARCCTFVIDFDNSIITRLPNNQ